MRYDIYIYILRHQRVEVKNEVVFAHIFKVYGGVEVQLQSFLAPALRVSDQIHSLAAFSRWKSRIGKRYIDVVA